MVSDGLRVFVSSRMSELENERKLVQETLADAGIDAWVFERAGARPESAEASFLGELQKSDVYLGLFWLGYGAYTIEEYEQAHGRGLPRFVYEKIASAPEQRDPRLQNFLNKIGDIRSGVTIYRFKDSADLRSRVASDVRQWLVAYYRRTRAGPAGGWVLPSGTDHFVGRRDDVDKLLLRLGENRIVTVSGLGGIGKSELVKRVAQEAASSEWATEGVCYMDLQAAQDVSSLVSTMSVAIGLASVPTASDLSYSLRGRRLYVLDDVYPAMRSGVAAVRALIRTLRSSSMPARFLITSREPLGLAGIESGYRLGQLAPRDARELVRRLAENNGYRWNPGDELLLRHLIRELDGYPLALTLAAGLISEIGLTAFMERWKQRRTAALTVPGLPSVDLDRQTSVDLSLTLSAERLSSRHGSTLLGLFADLPGGITEAAVQHLLGQEGIDGLDELLRRALVFPEGARRRMLVPVREFSSRYRSDVPSDVRTRFESYLTALVQRWSGNAQTWRRQRSAGVEALSDELPNLRTALERATAEGNHEFLARCSAALTRFLATTQPGEEAFRRLEAGAEAARAIGEPTLEASCLRGAGNVAWWMDRTADAGEMFARALDLSQGAHDPIGEAESLWALGGVDWLNGEYDHARRKFRLAATLFRQQQDPLGEADCIQSLGDTERVSNHDKLARRYYERALASYREGGDRDGEARCIRHIGDLDLNADSLDKASENYSLARDLFRSLNVPLQEALCIESLAEVEGARGNQLEARNLFEQSIATFAKLGDRHDLLYTLREFGNFLSEWKDTAGSEQCARRITEIEGTTSRAELPDRG